MHLDEEQLQRLLHGELGGREAVAREHLEACAECRFRMTEAKQEESWVFDRLRQLDHAAPTVGARTVSRSRIQALPRQRLAAGIFLAVAATGVAYAAPGSPLPRVVNRIIEAVSGASGRPGQAPVIPSVPTPEAGIVVGAGERLVIVFPAVSTGGGATVSLTGERDVVVRALDGAAFTSDFSRLSIDSVRPGGRFEIEIPRTAPLVEIRVGGRQVFLKRLSRIVTDAAPDGNGSYRFPLSGSER